MPKNQRGDVSGVSALAFRCFAFQKYGERVLTDMLATSTEDGAAALTVLHGLQYTSSVPFSTIACIMGHLRQHFFADLPELFFELGQFFFTWIVAEAGYEQFISQVSDTFIGFAKSLNQLLLQMFAILGNTTMGLAFRPYCTNVSSNSFDLGGFLLAPEETSSAWSTALHLEMHKGIMAQAASQVFGLSIDFGATEQRKLPSGKQLLVARISIPPLGSALPASRGKPGDGRQAGRPGGSIVGLDPDSFNDLFPFHFVMGMDFRVLQAGSAIRRMLPRMVPGVHIGEVLEVCVPTMSWDLDLVNEFLQNSMHSKVVMIGDEQLAFKGGLHRIPGGKHTPSGPAPRRGAPARPAWEWGESLVFLGSPLVSSVDDMQLHDLYLSDFPPSDMTPDQILMADTKHVKAACTLRLAQERNDELQAALAEALSSQDRVMQRPKLNTTSVADLVLGLLDGLVLGEELSTQDVLTVRQALLHAEGSDMWSPLVLDARAIDRDEEVNESLGRLLGAWTQRRERGSLDAMKEGSLGSSPRQAGGGRKPLSRSVSLSRARKSAESASPSVSGSASPRNDQAAGQPALGAAARADQAPRSKLASASVSASASGVFVATGDPVCSREASQQQRPAAAAGAAAAAAAEPAAAGAPQGQPGAVGDSCSSLSHSRRTVDAPAVGTTGAAPGCLSWITARLRLAKSSKPRVGPAATAAAAAAAAEQGQRKAVSPTAGSETDPRRLVPAPGAVAPVVPVEAPESSAASAPMLVTALLQQPRDELMLALGAVDSWQFDSFKLEAACDGRPLSCLAFFLMDKMDLIQRLHLNTTKLERFLMRIEEGYPDHPYHNRVHAADVLRTLYVVMTQGGVMEAMKAQGSWGPTDRSSQRRSDASYTTRDAVGMLSIMLAAIVHDYEHRGVNNDFLIRSSDPLAMLYNDISPLENHHVSASLSLMREEQYAFFPDAGTKLQSVMRKDIIDLVLATDMKQHFALSGTFSSKVVRPSCHSSANAIAEDGLQGPQDLVSARPAAGQGQGQAPGPGPGPGQPPRRKPQGRGSSLLKLALLRDKASGENAAFLAAPDPAGAWDDSTQMVVLKMALKCSDLGHLTSTTDVHRQWVGRLEEELFRQGDRERALGHPVSALMDRTKTGITKSQCGFINVVAQPMYELLAQAFPACDALVANLNRNVDFWTAVEAGMSCG